MNKRCKTNLINAMLVAVPTKIEYVEQKKITPKSPEVEDCWWYEYSTDNIKMLHFLENQVALLKYQNHNLSIQSILIHGD